MNARNPHAIAAAGETRGIGLSFFGRARQRDGASRDQINIVAKDLHASMAFYRRLRVSFREGDQAGDLFHLNGESGDNVALDLDSPGFAQIWNKGWAGRNDLQYASNCALSSAKLEGRIAKAVLLASGPQVEQR